MTDIDALRRETNRLCTIRLAGENPYAVLNEMQNHIEDLQAALDERQWRPMETCPTCQHVLLFGKNDEVHEGGLSEPDDGRYYAAWMPLPEPPK